MEKGLIAKLLSSAGLALFCVVFLWNFWSRGPYALGINAFVFFSLFFCWFLRVLHKNGTHIKSNMGWIIPVSLIITSFLLYDNLLLKIVSLLVLPGMFVLFYSNALLAEKKTIFWNIDFIMKIIWRAVSVLGEIQNSIKAYSTLIIPASKTNKHLIMRIMLGMLLLLVFSLTVFIPLLSSTDAVFSQKIQAVTSWLQNIFFTSLVYRMGVFAVSSILFFSVHTALNKPFEYQEKDTKQTDSIVVGIVIGGIFCIYAFFLWVQFNHLWVGVLPFDFKETEQLVKSGFWQLLTLSVINIFIYFFSYKKTVPLVQKILFAFTIASILLLASAGQRMGLYVTSYGLSYEKFFASYAVLYCAILYLWLIAQLCQRERANILKFLLTLFLWMFALLSMFPVEQFIFRSNMALHDLKDSRIILSEMRMLSPDVLQLVKKNKEKGLLEGEGYDWNEWIEDQEKLLSEKVWYERNIMNIAF